MHMPRARAGLRRRGDDGAGRIGAIFLGLREGLLVHKGTAIGMSAATGGGSPARTQLESLSSERISTVLDLPLSKAAEKL